MSDEPAKAKAPPLVAVKWLDAHKLTTDSEVTAEDAIEQAHCPLATVTCGYLIKSDGVGVTLASEWQDQGDVQTFRSVSFVPRGMVVSEKIQGRRSRKAKV